MSDRNRKIEEAARALIVARDLPSLSGKWTDFWGALDALRAALSTPATEGGDEVERLRSALRVIYTAVRGDEKAQHHDAREWLDARGIFNGDLDGSFASGDAVVAEVCRAALAKATGGGE